MSSALLFVQRRSVAQLGADFGSLRLRPGASRTRYHYCIVQNKEKAIIPIV